MKKAGGFTKRMVAILLSSMLAVGMIPGTALGAEVQENTVQEEEAITTYAVTLDANGGYFVNEWDDVIGDYIESTEILNKKIHVGETVTTFPVKEQENAVVTFMGWSLERDGEIVSQGYEEYVPIETCTLYAVWNVDESAVESESSAEDTVGEDIDNQEWSQASDDSQNNHEREPEVTDNSKDDNFVNDDTSLEEKVVEEDATSLTTEQFFEFQEKVKIWKVNNQITIIYDSTEDIQLGYWVYSGITDELLYSGMIAWNEQSSLYFETVDFDVLNGEKHLEDETIDDISIKDIPIRVVLDNGISQFEENISQDTGVVTIIEEEESSDEQISLSWNPIKNVDGYLILASYSDGRVVTFETDDTTNNFSMDKTDVDYLWVTPFLFAENTRFFGDVTVYHLGKSIVSDKDEDTLGNQDQLDMTQEATGENLEKSEEESQGTVGSIENEPNEKVDGKAETDEILSEGETESVSSEKLFSAINTPLDGDRYTVLLLDNSGSMNNASRLVIAKQAAIKFCEQMLAADGVNYISIVGYSKNINSASDFMEDISSLQSIINSMIASGDTNMNAALLQAVTLLNSTPKGAVKNIVLLSDGIPQTGSYDDSGKYSFRDSTDYYKFGNAVYKTAKSIDQDWNIYTLGFFQDLFGQDLSFACLLMHDIQNHGYYEVRSADDLDFTFAQIVKDITTNIIVEETEGVAGKEFTIKAEIKSSKTVPSVSNTTWTLERQGLSEISCLETSHNSIEQITWGAASIIAHGDGKYTISVPIKVSLPGVFTFLLSFNNESNKGEIVVAPKKVQNFRGNALNKKSVKMNWDSVEGSEYITGYNIQYSNNESFENSNSAHCKYIYDENGNPLPTATWDCNKVNKSKIYVRAAAYIEYSNIRYYGEYSDPVEISLSYNAERDGWCIPNKKEAFGDVDYSYSAMTYSKNYGDFSDQPAFLSYLMRVRKEESAKFTGNCFGTALLSVANYEGIVDLPSLFNRKGDGLSEYGYNVKKISSDSTKEFFSLDGNKDVVSLVERAFVSQYSSEYEESKSKWTNKQVINYLLYDENPQPILVSFEFEVGNGHAVVIDPSKKPEYIGGNQYELHIWDPNVPMGKDRLSNPLDVYSRESFLLLTDNGSLYKDEFEYLLVMNGKVIKDISQSNVNPFLSTHAQINFSFVKDLTPIFDQESKLTYRSFVDTAFIGSDIENIEVYNNNKNVLTILNGSMISCSDNLNVLPNYGGEGINNSIFSMKLDNLSYKSLSATVMLKGDSEEGLFLVNNDGDCSISFDKNNNIVTVNALSDSEIDILTPLSESDEDSVRIKTTIPSNQTLVIEKAANNILLKSTVELDCTTSLLHSDDKETDYREIVVLPNKNTDVYYKNGDVAYFHDYIVYKEIKEATCTEDGSQTLICDWCGQKKTEVIQATGHIWDTDYTIDVEATTESQGTKSIHCSICGEIKEGSVASIPKIDPEKIIAAGNCGDDTHYVIQENGNMLFYGTGAIIDYSEYSSSRPWSNYSSKIKNVVFTDGITHIGTFLFGSSGDDYSIESIHINGSVKTIGKGAFNFLKKLTSVSLSDGVEEIGNFAFYDCTNLTEIELPESLVKIGNVAFFNTGLLKSITIPGNVTYMGESPFEKSGLETIIVENGCTKIWDTAFRDCTQLKTITIPDTVTEIGKAAFCRCENLTEFALPDGVTSISYSAFSDCDSLEVINIPSTVCSIGEGAFRSCNNLEKVIFKGDAPVFDESTLSYMPGITAFYGDRITVCYPYKGEGWSKAKELAWNAKSIEWEETGRISLEDASVFNIPTLVYDGSELTFSPKVSKDYKLLENNTDYMVSFSDNINVGTGIITITGVGGYTGEVNKAFTILPASIENCIVTGIIDKTYTGNDIEQSLKVKVNNLELVDGKDFTVLYSNNINAGKATVTITGKGNYAGTLSKAFTINSISIANGTVSGISNKTYTGSALTQNLTVKVGDKTLTKDTDYTLSYSNNTNVGTATVTITGKGNYAGTLSKTFTISGISIVNATVTGISNKTYTGAAQTQNPTVKVGDKILSNGGDYTLSYANNTNVGTATVTITGKGNYTGTISKTFTIGGISIASATVTGISNKTYTGAAQTQNPTVKVGDKTLANGTDYTLSYANNTNVGTATVTITGKCNYTGSVSETFTITKASQNFSVKATSSTIDVRMTTTVAASGAKETNKYTFTSSDTSVATVDDSGTVTGKAVGTVTITVRTTETANYKAGSKTVKITVIEPQTKNIEDAVISGLTDRTYNGSEQTQTPVVKLTDGTTLTEGTDYSVSYDNNKNSGIATVIITAIGSKYEGTTSTTFNINKATQDFTVKAAASSIDVGKTTKVTATGAEEKPKYTFTSSNAKIATVNTAGTVTGKSAGTVTITVRAAETKNYKAASKTLKITVNKSLKKPGNCHFTKWNNSKYTSCRISWNKVDGAEGYQTLLSWTDGSHASETIVKSNILYRDCTVAANHVSQMKVRAFYTAGGKRVYGPWSNVDYITPSPAKLTTKNASSGTNLKMNISWNIIYGCNGYNVFITTNPNGTWYWNQSTSEKATATSASIVKCGGAKLKKNTRYYVRIVTRRKRNGVFCTVPMPASNTYIGSFIIK